ncbi:MAG: hypothetical protein NTW16_18055 [Bacteroidetes bacterium]|nr:hypothetical protein [Bacteroidota bacterium]
MKNLYKFLIVLGLLFTVPSLYLFAQVGINAENTAPANSAMLDVQSTTKGILIPRMTLSQRNAISTPATGLMIYQTDSTTGFRYYNGSTWIFLSPGGNSSWDNGSTIIEQVAEQQGSNGTVIFSVSRRPVKIVFSINYDFAANNGCTGFNNSAFIGGTWYDADKDGLGIVVAGSGLMFANTNYLGKITLWEPMDPPPFCGWGPNLYQYFNIEVTDTEIIISRSNLITQTITISSRFFIHAE